MILFIELPWAQGTMVMRLIFHVFSCFFMFATPILPAAADLPRVLFFGNPMQSDNDVVRRSQPDELSVAERHFAELSKGVFQTTITQDGSLVTTASLSRYDVVVFFTAINPPGVDIDGLVEWVRKGGAFVGIHSTANTYQNHAGFGEMLGARTIAVPGEHGKIRKQKFASKSMIGPIPPPNIFLLRSRSAMTSINSRSSIPQKRNCSSAWIHRALTSKIQT